MTRFLKALVGLQHVPLLENNQVLLGPGGTDHNQVGVAVGCPRSIFGGLQIRKDYHLLVQTLITVNRHNIDGNAI